MVTCANCTLDNLISIERIDEKWCVVWYSFVGCDISQAMLLSKHEKIEYAKKYKKQFLETFNDFINNNFPITE